MARSYVNIHEGDSPLDVNYIATRDHTPRVPFVAFEIGDVTFFLHDADTLLKIAAEAGLAYSELTNLQQEAAR